MNPTALAFSALFLLASQVGQALPFEDGPISDRCETLRQAFLAEKLAQGEMSMQDLYDGGWTFPTTPTEFVACGVPVEQVFVRAGHAESLSLAQPLKPQRMDTPPEHVEDVCPVDMTLCAAAVNCFYIQARPIQCAWAFAYANQATPIGGCSSCITLTEGGGGGAFVRGGTTDVNPLGTCGFPHGIGTFEQCDASRVTTNRPSGTCTASMDVTSHSWFDMNANAFGFPIQYCS